MFVYVSADNYTSNLFRINTFLGHLDNLLTTNNRFQAFIVDKDAWFLNALISLHANTMKQFTTFNACTLGQNSRDLGLTLLFMQFYTV